MGAAVISPHDNVLMVFCGEQLMVSHHQTFKMKIHCPYPIVVHNVILAHFVGMNEFLGHFSL